MTEAGLDIKDPTNCNRFPPLGGIRWHRVVLDVRPPHLQIPKRTAAAPSGMLVPWFLKASGSCVLHHSCKIIHYALFSTQEWRTPIFAFS